MTTRSAWKEGSCDGQASLFQGHISGASISRVLRALVWKEQQKAGAPTVLPPRIVIKRLLLPLALAMFNNYNGRSATGDGMGEVAGGSRIKLREKERARKVDEERSRWER